MKIMSKKNIIRWEKAREEGKYIWIMKLAFLWGIFVFSFSNLINWFLGIETNISLFGLLTYILGGFVVSSIIWKINECEYQTYLLKSKIPNELKF